MVGGNELGRRIPLPDSPGTTEPVGAVGMEEDEIRNHDISSIPCPSRGEKEIVDLQWPRWCVKKWRDMEADGVNGNQIVSMENV